jgi:alanine racemase
MFEPLYTAEEMRAAEERYPGYPETIPELMERAGTAVAREAIHAYAGARRFACVCGGGSNGGDGRVAARVLRENGLEAVETTEPEGYEVIVDALFGTGFTGEPRAEAAALIERMNAAGAPVISVDLPSGVDASTGEIAGTAVRADLTVTFHAPKVGLLVAPGRFQAGRVVVADIGLEHVATVHRRATVELLRRVPLRREGDTKYTAGSVLVVGGQPGMTGACALTARAALRADAGYVVLAVPAESLPVVESLVLEAVKIGWEAGAAVETIAEAAERARALALGPGLGRGEGRRDLVRSLLREIDLPAVVDADALFGLEPIERSAGTVLTPHSGELARLLGADSVWVDAHRLQAARAAADRFGAVVLLKGPDTIVATPDAGVVVSDFGGPSLATAGTGDVLTGILGAFLAKGLEPSTRFRPRSKPDRENARGVHRSTFTIDLGAIRRNAETLLRAAAGAELWAVVKADGYGHGAVDAARAALAGGARVLAVATLGEALSLRAALAEPRILVLGPEDEEDVGRAREARLELVAAGDRVPEGVPVHLKLDTGMGRWGLSELPAPTRDVVAVMSHLASADTDPDLTRTQIDAFRQATSGLAHLTRHLANSAGTLRFPEASFDAVRCGIALYGISPFGADPAADGLEPALRWESRLALVKRLATGESTGYGARFVAERPTWIGIVPIGYADGFRRDLTGTEVLVDGERRRVVGTVSMDAFAVELDRELAVGAPVTLIGEGVLIEDHARVAGTIGYELATGLDTRPERAKRVVRDG